MNTARKSMTRNGRRGKPLRLLLTVLLITLCLTGCGGTGGTETPASTPKPSPAATPSASPAASPTEAPEPEPEESPARAAPQEALKVACTPFSGLCGPFDKAEGSDLLLLRLTQTPLLCRNADGSFPETAEGVGAAGVRVMSRGDGSTVLRLAMRENVRYADGSYADADDLIFTLYVLLDPDYDGGIPLRDCAFTGLLAYRTSAAPEIAEKYALLYDEAAAGEGPLAELAEFCLRDAWSRSLRSLSAWCRDRYLDTYASYALGVSPESARQEEGCLRAFTLWCADLAEAADDGGNMTGARGERWNPASGHLPTQEEMTDLFMEAYGSAGAFDEALDMETERLAKEEFIRRCSAADPENVPPLRISGITRVDDYTVDLQLDSFSSQDLDRLGQLWLLPMPLYGEESLYRPEEGTYGFLRGDLSALRARRGEILPGAGAFLAVGTAEDFHLEANLYYYLGSPRVGEIWFAQAPRSELADLVARGEADLTFLPGSPEVFAQARETPGLALRSVASDVWGVLRLNSAPPAEEDQEETPAALREVLLDLAAACCRASAETYFAGAALPFSGGETEEDALAELQVLLDALPEGEELRFTALVPGRGQGDHPCFAGLERTSELLEALGVELTLRDFETDEAFWAAVDGGEGDLWPSAEVFRSPAPADGQPEQNARLVYRRLDLLALNAERFELLSLPVELTWAKDHISVVETWELK